MEKLKLDRLVEELSRKYNESLEILERSASLGGVMSQEYAMFCITEKNTYGNAIKSINTIFGTTYRLKVNTRKY